MPGMLSTILDVGLNDRSVRGLIGLTGNPRLAWDSYRRFIQMYSEVVDSLPAEPSREALTDTITKLLEGRSAEVVAVYLHAFQAMDETGWSTLDDVLANDARVALG